jgi:hypothetical protein
MFVAMWGVRSSVLPILIVIPIDRGGATTKHAHGDVSTVQGSSMRDSRQTRVEA